DPAGRTSRDESWLTRFWMVSLKTQVAGVALLAQAMHGDTAIADDDDPDELYITDFDSAFVLASYDIGDDWRISCRAEAFQTRMHPDFLLFDEDGHAFTGAVMWSARDWLRVSAEVLDIDSRRLERTLEVGPAERDDVQFQLGLRAFL